MNKTTIRRGDMYYANLNPVIGGEEGDFRPVLVVQGNTVDKYSNTVVIVPITLNLRRKKLPTHVQLPYYYGLEADSIALVEQIRSVDRSRLTEYIGRVGGKVQDDVDIALASCVGIEQRRAPKGEMMVMTLCPRCESDFRDSGYILVKKGWQAFKEDCDFCKVRQGLSFGIFGTP